MGKRAGVHHSGQSKGLEPPEPGCGQSIKFTCQDKSYTHRLDTPFHLTNKVLPHCCAVCRCCNRSCSVLDAQRRLSAPAATYRSLHPISKPLVSSWDLVHRVSECESIAWSTSREPGAPPRTFLPYHLVTQDVLASTSCFSERCQMCPCLQCGVRPCPGPLHAELEALILLCLYTQVILKSWTLWGHPSILCAAPLHVLSPAASSCTVLGSPSSAGRSDMTRGFAATSKLRPKFVGGKIKTSGGLKERFKLTGTGEILICQMHL